MWQPPWGCYSISGCPSNPNPGDFLGQPAGAFHGWWLQSSCPIDGTQSSTRCSYNPPGRTLWQAPNSTMPLGNFTGAIVPWSWLNCTSSYAGAPMLPTNLPAHTPPMLYQSMGRKWPRAMSSTLSTYSRRGNRLQSPGRQT